MQLNIGTEFILHYMLVGPGSEGPAGGAGQGLDTDFGGDTFPGGQGGGESGGGGDDAGFKWDTGDGDGGDEEGGATGLLRKIWDAVSED